MLSTEDRDVLIGLNFNLPDYEDFDSEGVGGNGEALRAGISQQPEAADPPVSCSPPPSRTLSRSNSPVRETRFDKEKLIINYDVSKSPADGYISDIPAVLGLIPRRFTAYGC